MLVIWNHHHCLSGLNSVTINSTLVVWGTFHSFFNELPWKVPHTTRLLFMVRLVKPDRQWWWLDCSAGRGIRAKLPMKPVGPSNVVQSCCSVDTSIRCWGLLYLYKPPDVNMLQSLKPKSSIRPHPPLSSSLNWMSDCTECVAVGRRVNLPCHVIRKRDHPTLLILFFGPSPNISKQYI